MIWEMLNLGTMLPPRIQQRFLDLFDASDTLDPESQTS